MPPSQKRRGGGDRVGLKKGSLGRLRCDIEFSGGSGFPARSTICPRSGSFLASGTPLQDSTQQDELTRRIQERLASVGEKQPAVVQ
jgi:hypothetical protein